LALFHDGDIFRLRSLGRYALANLQLLPSTDVDIMAGRQENSFQARTFKADTLSRPVAYVPIAAIGKARRADELDGQGQECW
jgi:hypothetical protein